MKPTIVLLWLMLVVVAGPALPLADIAGTLAYGDSVTGTLDEGETVIYELKVTPNRYVAVRVDTLDVHPFGALDGLDGEGGYYSLFVSRDTKAKSRLDVFLAGEPDTYYMELRGEGPYTVSLEPGDDLVEVRAPLSVGETISGSVDKGQFVVHEVQVPDDSLFTLRMSGFGYATILDASRQQIPLEFESYGVGNVYPVTDETPYLLGLIGNQDYRLTVEAGDTLRADMQSLGLGEEVQGTLAAGEVVYYELMIGDEDEFSLIRRSPGMPANLTSGGVVYLYPFQSAIEHDDHKIVDMKQVFNVGEHDAPPYILQLEGEGDYTLRLEAGNILSGGVP
ncbi:MAG: hypothetical protein CL610_30355 [Anaerolineaceae bacterium]|nr:hypothetical protein [Anaerolineaceae bacterium]